MDEEVQSQVLTAWNALPDGCRRHPATESELEAFETRYGPIPPDHRWFLQMCGGGTIGSEWVDGIKELGRTQEKFLAESKGSKGWTIKEVFVIGWTAAAILLVSIMKAVAFWWRTTTVEVSTS